MSSFNAFGFFALAAGRHVPTQLPGATYPIHHCKPVDLDALYISAIPGDVNSDEYENTIPECPTFVYGVGHIPHNHTAQVFPDSSKAFTISLSECVFPATRRWLNVPSPRTLSCTQFFGICNGFSDSGLLRSCSTYSFSIGLPIPRPSPTRLQLPQLRLDAGNMPPSALFPPSVVTPVHNTGAGTLDNPVVRPASPFNAVAGPGPSTTSTYETRSKKRRASTQSIPPTLDDGNDTDVADATPVKSKGKKAKQ
ncbi:hypothetical protein B0H14DRAFT_2608952 [Mycena olivaceomarginata]|nr:hypothetical protein B0H14DRAFT_2608952 [Mycena olivaceomarginata]